MYPNDSSSISALGPLSRRIALDSLKACPVCGAINAKLNGECFVCRWHGQFENDPDTIEAGVVELMQRCPELADFLTEWPTPKLNLWNRVVRFFQRGKPRSIDIRA